MKKSLKKTWTSLKKFGGNYQNKENPKKRKEDKYNSEFICRLYLIEIK